MIPKTTLETPLVSSVNLESGLSGVWGTVFNTFNNFKALVNFLNTISLNIADKRNHREITNKLLLYDKVRTVDWLS